MIENYILKNKKIRTIIWLFDIRREIDELDEMLIEWLLENNLNFCVVLTKCDKETQGAIAKKKRVFRRHILKTDKSSRILQKQDWGKKRFCPIWQMPSNNSCIEQHAIMSDSYSFNRTNTEQLFNIIYFASNH